MEETYEEVIKFVNHKCEIRLGRKEKVAIETSPKKGKKKIN